MNHNLLFLTLLSLTPVVLEDSVSKAIHNNQILYIKHCLNKRYITEGEEFTLTCVLRQHNEDHNREKVNKVRIEYTSYKSDAKPRILMGTDRHGRNHAPWVKNSKKKEIFTQVHPKRFDEQKDVIYLTVKSDRLAQLEFSGKYACQAYRTPRKIIYESVCHIIVGRPPTSVKIEIETFNYTANKIISIKCSASRDTRLMEIYINDVKQYEIVHMYKNALAKSLNINNKPELYDGAMIKCTAINNFGATSNETSISILYPPRKHLIKVNGDSNSTISITNGTMLRCTSKGNPPPDVAWLSPNLTLFYQTNNPNVIVAKEDIVHARVVCEVKQKYKNKLLANVKKRFYITVGSMHKAEDQRPSVNEIQQQTLCWEWRLFICISSLLVIVSFMIIDVLPEQFYQLWTSNLVAQIFCTFYKRLFIYLTKKACYCLLTLVYIILLIICWIIWDSIPDTAAVLFWLFASFFVIAKFVEIHYKIYWLLSQNSRTENQPSPADEALQPLVSYVDHNSGENNDACQNDDS